MMAVTSYGVSAMLGKKNGGATVLRREIMHCRNSVMLLRRKSLSRRHLETFAKCTLLKSFLTTVYAVFSRSFVANEQFEEVVRVTNGNALAH
jgi:hypothetical protein